MQPYQIVQFVKFFQEEWQADQFLQGKLYMNRLSYFRKLEKCDDGRPDSQEGVSIWLQPRGLEIDFTAPGMEGLKITGEDLAAPVAIYFDYVDHFHVFCICAMPFDPRGLPEKIEISKAEKILADRMHVDDRCLKFGPYAVVTRADRFSARCKERLAETFSKYHASMVDYYDDETFSGSIDPSRIPFSKQKRFSYQREFRLCFSDGTQGMGATTFDLGDISEFSVKMDSSRVNSAFELRLGLTPT